MSQAFKETDTVEAKVTATIAPMLTLIGNGLTNFHEQVYEAQGIGEMLYDSGRDPMARAVSRQTYLQSYAAIHQLFTRPGTAEFYLSVFRAIWGDDVEVEFTVPAPGKLEINIEALEASQELFMARRIVDSAYVYDEVIDEEGDNIVFQVPTGIRSQHEIDILMKELYPAGLWVETTLTIV